MSQQSNQARASVTWLTPSTEDKKEDKEEQSSDDETPEVVIL
tara:strand:- start:51 stop:176 length:126 start_codon:yes stop_codon:yes gene_type:complete